MYRFVNVPEVRVHAASSSGSKTSSSPFHPPFVNLYSTPPGGKVSVTSYTPSPSMSDRGVQLPHHPSITCPVM